MYPTPSSTWSQCILLTARLGHSVSYSQLDLVTAYPTHSSTWSQRILLPARLGHSVSYSQLDLVTVYPTPSSTWSQCILLTARLGHSVSYSQLDLVTVYPTPSSKRLTQRSVCKNCHCQKAMFPFQQTSILEYSRPWPGTTLTDLKRPSVVRGNPTESMELPSKPSWSTHSHQKSCLQLTKQNREVLVIHHYRCPRTTLDNERSHHKPQV